MEKTFEDIKNKHAQGEGFDDWDDLRSAVQDDVEYDQHWLNVCNKVQRLALRRAVKNAKIGQRRKECANVFFIVKKSITGEQNLVK